MADMKIPSLAAGAAVSGSDSVAARQGAGTDDVKITVDQINTFIKGVTTITAPGTTGDQTINTKHGVVNFAAAATTLVVTNNLVTTSSMIDVTVRSNDSTAKSAAYVPASGSFTIYLNAAATAETAVGFSIEN